MIEKMMREIDCGIPRVYQAIVEQLQFMRQEPRGHFEIRQIAVRIAISHKRPIQKDFDELLRAMHALLWEHDHLVALTDGLWIPGLEVMPPVIRKKRIPINEPYYRRLCQHAWERHIPALLQNPFGEAWPLAPTPSPEAGAQLAGQQELFGARHGHE